MSASFLDSNVLLYLFDERSHRKFGIVGAALEAGCGTLYTEELQAWTDH